VYLLFPFTPLTYSVLSVGLGSDFDGMSTGPEGLENVSKYPELVSIVSSFGKNLHNNTQIAELYRRKWNQYELAGLTGGNLLRVMEGAERVAELLQTRELPLYDLYHERKDIPKYPGSL